MLLITEFARQKQADLYEAKLFYTGSSRSVKTAEEDLEERGGEGGKERQRQKDTERQGDTEKDAKRGGREEEEE